MVLPFNNGFGLDDLARVNKKSVKSAGERYFPGVKRESPNMEIAEFNMAVAGLIGGDDFRACVNNIKENLQKHWDETARPKVDHWDELPNPGDVMRALEDLANTAPGNSTNAIAKVREHASDARQLAKKVCDKIHEQQAAQECRDWLDNRQHSRALGYSDALRRVVNFMPQKEFSRISGELAYMHANACGVYEAGALVLFSEWGMGKTHSLCHLAEKQQALSRPVLLVLAKDFHPHKSPGNALALHTGLAGSFAELLKRLNALGREAGERALLLVDGINENNPDGVWTRKLEKFLRQVRKFPYVGVIVSYRIPFKPGLSEQFLPQISCMEHPGFREISFKEQADFLCYYGIRETAMPLMAEEFMRPLMLKITCGIFKKLSKKKQRKGFADIASGQKGMTYILERYIKQRAKGVTKKHNYLPPLAVWQLVKKEIAPYMAQHMTEGMPAPVLLSAICGRFGVSQLQAGRILHDMKQEGVVILGRGVLWKWLENRPVLERNGKPWRGMVVQMPYQRFGSHVVARYLLDKHLKTGTESELCGCFSENLSLGKIFAMTENGPRFHYSATGENLAEALILEFPERVKNVACLAPEKRELLFCLPNWEQQTGAYYGPFARGLYWREKNAITRQTVRLAEGYLNWDEDQYAKSTPFRYGLIEALLSSACRHDTRLCANWLYKRIKSMNMPDRDVGWGAMLREARMNGWTDNLFSWVSHLEKQEVVKMDSEAGRNYIALLSLFLGSTDRPLRDNATKALVVMGEKFPAALFNHTRDVLDFNDIYFPERMLAACYGVAMSQWAVPDAKEFHETFPAFARAVVKNVFAPGGKLLTHHALVRDYALGIAAVARQLKMRFSKTEEKFMKIPFPAVPPLFPSPADIDDGNFSRATSAFTFDFYDRYSLPHISPDGARSDIQRQVKWRVINLGYENDKFENTERLIRYRNYEESSYGKTDSCGKKYSWIAYHEMCGLLASRGQLSRQTREIEGVMDPSFPVPPGEWLPEFNKLDMTGDDVQWFAEGPVPEYGHLLNINALRILPGPWVMLDGDVTHKDRIIDWSSDKWLAAKRRDVFTFLRGLLVNPSDIPRLRSALCRAEYPGNHAIPPCLNKYHVFSGEIPWSPHFTRPHPDEERQFAFDEIPAETTAVHHAGNQYHGERFMFSEAWHPAPDICAHLRLVRRGRGVDLADKDGKTATLYRADNGRLIPNPRADEQKDEYQFLYLRKDLLDEYLRAANKRLVWIIWGERRLLGGSPYTDGPPELMAANNERKYLHKRFVVYESDN